MRLLITGGAGFVGHHFVEHFLRTTDAEIVVLDKLTYASTWDRLRDIEAFDDSRVQCLSVDFSQPIPLGVQREIGQIDYLLHLGAETHVDRSIADPLPFVQANVLGTLHMLELAKVLQPTRFFYFGTDEVFGPAPAGVFYGEYSRHAPTNPYAATKSAGEMLCHAYRTCYGVPVVITRTMNCFGERQHCEKYIPLVMRSVLMGQEVSIHADATRTIAGSRFYLHARNVAAAYAFLLTCATPGEVVHIVGEREVDNLTLARTIADLIGKPLHAQLVSFHESRPGHDLRYALDGSKLAAMGWTYPLSFDRSLTNTVRWSLAHPQWLFSQEVSYASRCSG